MGDQLRRSAQGVRGGSASAERGAGETHACEEPGGQTGEAVGLWRKLLRRRWSKTDRRRVELFLLRRGEAAQAGSVFFTAVLLRLGGRVGGRVKLGGKGVGGKGNAAPRAVDLLRVSSSSTTTSRYLAPHRFLVPLARLIRVYRFPYHSNALFVINKRSFTNKSAFLLASRGGHPVERLTKRPYAQPGA